MSAPVAFHWLRARATCHATEQPERVQAALATVLQQDPDDLASSLEVTPITSHYGGEVQLVEATLTRAREIRGALAALVAPQATQVAKQLDARLDEDLVLYLRFEKQAAAQGAIVPTVGEDAVQVRIKVQAHPATRENAVAAWHRQFDAMA